ncbi:hypothetical protein MRB53_009599 [Persea americana]|uniref:Uncharacterized protein n=1 Tax=Persea americana TaxID=3435 RepID=A0ACC2LPL8_PERAE|nr:hypothetical protein MRB53_009599 [Persea americana]
MEEAPVPMPLPACFEELARTHLYNVQPAVWVCEKLLEISDTDKGLRRLFIRTEGSEKRLKPALTEQEKGRLRQGIPVLGLDQNGKSWNLQLKYWPSISVNVLKKDRIDLVNENHLMAGVDTVQMWLSRYSSRDQPPEEENKLCFLIGWKREQL